MWNVFILYGRKSITRSRLKIVLLLLFIIVQMCCVRTVVCPLNYLLFIIIFIIRAIPINITSRYTAYLWRGLGEFSTFQNCIQISIGCKLWEFNTIVLIIVSSEFKIFIYFFCNDFGRGLHARVYFKCCQQKYVVHDEMLFDKFANSGKYKNFNLTQFVLLL